MNERNKDYMTLLQSQHYRSEFSSYSEHIVSAWFLRATKLEVLKSPGMLMQTMLITSDFAENILVVRKHETSDQFFHRLQVCLYGSVCTQPSAVEPSKMESVSHIITSDYK